MSHLKVSGAVAAVTALTLSVSAYGDTGKSPNGPPGPAGNPSQPAAQPQANGPQGPAGNESHGKSTAKAKSHGKSGGNHGKSQSSHDKNKSHANPNPGTPRKGGREDRPADKITICHATRSQKNPYVEITISTNGLHGHGPAGDSRHHEGSWKDIIPAPAGGCPTTAQTSATTVTKETPTTTPVVAPAATAPAGQQAVLGAQAQGTAPGEDDAEAPGESKVLGASVSGTTPPRAALAARAADDQAGSLPFTGFELAVILLAAAAALLGGFALRRATAQHRA